MTDLIEETRRLLLAWGREFGGEIEEMAYSVANGLAAVDYDADNHAARERLYKDVRALADMVGR